MKKKILFVLTVLLCMPIIVLAGEEKTLVVEDKSIVSGKCYKSICYDVQNNIITMDNSNAAFMEFGFDEVNIEIKNDVVWDMERLEEIYEGNVFFENKDKLSIHINENSTLTIKNSTEQYGFADIDDIVISGEKNSKLIFKDITYGFELWNSNITIENLTIESTNPLRYFIMSANYSEKEVGLININKSNINIDTDLTGTKANSLLLSDFIISDCNKISIHDSTINSKTKMVPGEINAGNMSTGFNTESDIDIKNSSISLDGYSIGIQTGFDKKLTISDSTLSFKDFAVSILTGDFVFDNSVYKGTSNLSSQINYDIYDVENGPAIGIVSYIKFNINSGYLEFSDEVAPFLALIPILDDSPNNSFFIFGDDLTANKEYDITRVYRSDISLVALSKKGSEEIIEYNSEEDFSSYFDIGILGIILRSKTKIHFDAGDGTGKMEDVEVDYLTDKLPENKLTAPEGKRFKGWSLSKDGEIITTLNNTDEVTLYAVWEDIPKEEKKEKENPNTGTILSITSVIGMLALGGYLLYASNKKSKFN